MKEFYSARLTKLEYEKEPGTLISANEVKMQTFNRFRAFRDQMRGFAGRKSLVISVFCGWIDALMACFTRGWPDFGLRELLGAEKHFAKHRPLPLAA